MINFAVIGSNWITEKFINGTLVNNDLKLTAVYSRSMSSAQTFADKFNLQHCFDDLTALSQSHDEEITLITDSVTDLTQAQQENSMSHEASFFARQIKEGKMDPQAVQRATITSAVITEIRRLTGVKFPADRQTSAI